MRDQQHEYNQVEDYYHQSEEPGQYVQKFENKFTDKSLNIIDNVKEQFDLENQITPLTSEINKVNTEVILEKIQDEVLDKKKK